jgi:hypothetical protein
LFQAARFRLLQVFFNAVFEAMVLDDIARVVCQTDRKYPLYLRAITLFGFQVAILSPADPARESKARVLAALKILESLEIAVGSDADLENRLELPDYRDVLNIH